MAFQMDITLSSGIAVSGAYVKITQLSWGAGNVTLYLSAFKDQISMQDGFPKIEGYLVIKYFTPILGQGVNDFVTQGYNYLKTLPEFQGVVDV